MYINLLVEMTKKSINKTCIAAKLQISRSSFVKKLNGKQEFKMNEIKRLLSIFNCTFEYLFETSEVNNAAE